jgi:hypothetical protein
MQMLKSSFLQSRSGLGGGPTAGGHVFREAGGVCCCLQASPLPSTTWPEPVADAWSSLWCLHVLRAVRLLPSLLLQQSMSADLFLTLHNSLDAQNKKPYAPLKGIVTSTLRWMMIQVGGDGGVGLTAAAGACLNSRPGVCPIQARAGKQHGKGFGRKQLPKTVPKVRSCCCCCCFLPPE